MVFSSFVVRADDSLQRYSYTQYHMGVDARIVVYAPSQAKAEEACAAAFTRIGELDWVMSDYRPQSELMRLCEKAGGKPVRVSADLFKALARAVEVSKQTEGAFDCTVGPLIALWRKARKTALLPDPKAIEEARKRVGWRRMRLFPRSRSVQLTTKGMKLDLGGLGKGFAADEAHAVLQKFGITRALVQMGGDIVVRDAPPNTEGWMVLVPNAGTDQKPIEMPLKNCAVSTSGDTEQFVIIEGKRYSHIIEPRTGQALTERVQVTVIAPNGFTSDPLSKGFCILGEAERNRLLRLYPNTKVYRRLLTTP
jgi:thiamine biosynthesis lipoprotein